MLLISISCDEQILGSSLQIPNERTPTMLDINKITTLSFQTPDIRNYYTLNNNRKFKTSFTNILTVEYQANHLSSKDSESEF